MMRVMRVMMFVVMMIEWGVVMSSSDLNKDLIAACAEGKDNVDEIRGLIEKGADANTLTSRYRPLNIVRCDQDCILGKRI
jgi:hypothetical protein